MIKFDNYKDIKITKVKSWIIYFTYRNRKFFIKEVDCDCESSIVFYEKKYVADNRFELEFLGGTDRGSILDLVPLRRGLFRRGGYTYSQIDRKAFLMHLVHLGLAESTKDLNMIIDKKLSKVNENKKMIKELENVISKLRLENCDLLKFN